MKLAFFVVSGLLIFLTTFKNPTLFIGRYRTITGPSCDRAGGYRADVTKSKYAGSLEALTIQYHGPEPVIVEIPIQNGKVRSPGSPANSSDTVKVFWTSAKILKTSITTVGSKDGQALESVTDYTLSLAGEKLTIVKAVSGREETRCDLTMTSVPI